jgi:hypothetical protein
VFGVGHEIDRFGRALVTATADVPL